MAKKGIVSYLTSASHRLFGGMTPQFPAFRLIYHKSGISGLFESYMALMIFVTLAAFVSAFAVGALLHHSFFNLTLMHYILAVLTFSCVISLTVPVSFILYPLYRQSQKRKEIDANLVYTTGYMGVLSAGGIPIERMFERVAQVEKHPPIRNTAKGLITNIKMFGSDITSSLMEAAVRSPSEAFSKLLVGIMNAVKTSGDLKSLLVFETKKLLHAKREQQKKTLGTLTVLGEIYITTMVIGPILFIVMLTILSIMGNVTFGLSPSEQLNLIVFFGLPAISAIFIVILNGVLPEEE
jgi:archaellum biogenesis protein FlaJ (TadC family)